jgi:hypothetical protein
MFLKELCLVTCYLIKTVIISLPPTNTCCQGFRTSAVRCNTTFVWRTVVDITKRFSLTWICYFQREYNIENLVASQQCITKHIKVIHSCSLSLLLHTVSILSIFTDQRGKRTKKSVFYTVMSGQPFHAQLLFTYKLHREYSNSLYKEDLRLVISQYDAVLPRIWIFNIAVLEPQISHSVIIVQVLISKSYVCALLPTIEMLYHLTIQRDSTVNTKS